MNQLTEVSDSPVPVICRFLRAKTDYGTLEGGENKWHLIDSSMTVYWYLCTMSASTPDDSFAHSDFCRKGRICFAAPRVDIQE